MAEREGNSSVMSEKLWSLYREEAEQEANGKSIGELESELKKSSQRNGFFNWLSKKIGALFNLAKVAVMSVFLGKRETSKRLDAGEREARQEALRNEAKTAIKREVIKERILEQKARDSEKTEPGEELKSDCKGEKEQSAVTSNADRTDSAGTARTIFAQQLEHMTEKYQNGLKSFISLQTGIDENYIRIENTHNRIKLSFPCAEKPSEYYKGMTINSQGCSVESTKTSKALATLVLYYTANVYRDSKNQTQFPGTIPSKNMIRDQYSHFMSLADKNADARHEVQLFGHILSFCKNETGILIQLDGKRIHVEKEAETVERIQKEFRYAILGNISARNYSIPLEGGQYLRFQEKWPIRGDYARISELSNILHDTTRSDIHECYYSKYSFTNLQAYFQKALEDVTKDDGGIGRGINFHGHHIHMQINEVNEISGVVIDNEVIYGTVDGKGTGESAGTLSNEKIADIMALTLEGALAREGMYWNVENSTPEQAAVSELDSEGRLPADHTAYMEPSLDEKNAFMEQIMEEAEIYEMEALEF